MKTDKIYRHNVVLMLFQRLRRWTKALGQSQYIVQYFNYGFIIQILSGFLVLFLTF